MNSSYPSNYGRY